MSRIEYETFDVVITPKNGNGLLYNVIAHGPRGQQNPTPVEFNVNEVILPGSKINRNNGGGLRHLTLGNVGAQRDYPVLWTGPPDETRAREFGGRLFRAVFKDSVRDLFAQCRTLARANLRMRFDLSQSPELAVWPWEYLYNPDMDQFFAMFADTPIIRYLPRPTSEGPLEVVAPLRILLVVSLPRDVAKLNTEKELSSIRDAMKEWSDHNFLKIEVLQKASFSGLLKALEKASDEGTPFHILHFIGHGIFDTEKKQGKLLLTQKNGSGQAVDGSKMGALLRKFRDHLRLVIINACEGARLSRTDSYAGVAQRILQSGDIPAVLAMQFRITDQAAITFAKLFYRGLAANKPLEDCLATARLLMYGNNDEEWATPVLYMRASDGYILQVQPPPETIMSDDITGAPPLPNLTCHYDEIKKALNKGQLVFFLGLDVNLYGRQLIPSWIPGSVAPSNFELSEYLLRTHGYEFTGAPVANIAQRLVVHKKRADLHDAFASTFGATIALPELYSFLARVVKNVKEQLHKHPDPVRRRPLIVTANYDKSVERAFNDQGIDDYHVISYLMQNDQAGEFQHTHVKGSGITSVTPINDRNKETVLTDYNPVIIKLPGAVESGSPNYAVTEDHFLYLSRKDLIKMLPSQLEAALKTSHHLYLGYDVQDWPFRALLYAIWEDLKPKYYEAWAVIPQANDPSRPYWAKCDVEVIQAPLEDYVAGLEQYLLRP